MKKQLTKIKIAAENLSRSSKTDYIDSELEAIEKQVEKYREVLEKMVRKLPSVSSGITDNQDREKRIKKQNYYKIGAALEDSSKELSKDMPLHHVLLNCGILEKSLAECVVDNELETENEVVRRLRVILDNDIQEITLLKRNVYRTIQEYTSLKRSYETAIRLDEPQSKINHIKDQQEQCEAKLEKERDAWAALMFELISKEDVIVQCIRDYVSNQRDFYNRALHCVNSSLASIEEISQSTIKSRFGTSLHEHLESTKREISYIIELCVCCLIENGLYEEGILRVGCASTKLRRMKHALEAQYVKTPLPVDYQDPHVIGSILKLYLRELPEPLLTHKYYKDYIRAAEQTSEANRKKEIKSIIEMLPAENYSNLRYLTGFLKQITQFVEYNKMNSQNLAIVMSPNILWPSIDKSSPADYMGQVNCSSAANIIVDLLISQWEYFFEGEINFFTTLQRGKLFVDSKCKTNSSNEHLERNENDANDTPRCSTLRRQKPYAPSPPVNRIANKANSESSHLIKSYDSPSAQITKQEPTSVKQKDCQSVKEVYSSNGDSNAAAVSPIANNYEVNNKSAAISPIKDQIQSTLANSEIVANNSDISQYPPVAKPIPMTRTQFLSIDTTAQQTSDRNSCDSNNSITFKPDIPQKPKIPKRPMVLNFNNAGNRKDDERLTNNEVFNNTTQKSCQKTAEQLVQEHCDNVTALQAKIGTSNTGCIPSIYTNRNDNQQIHTTREECNIYEQQPSSQLINTQNIQNRKNASVNLTLDDIGFIDDSPKIGSVIPSENRITPNTPTAVNLNASVRRPTVPAPPPPNSIKKLTAD